MSLEEALFNLRRAEKANRLYGDAIRLAEMCQEFSTEVARRRAAYEAYGNYLPLHRLTKKARAFWRASHAYLYDRAFWDKYIETASLMRSCNQAGDILWRDVRAWGFAPTSCQEVPNVVEEKG